MVNGKIQEDPDSIGMFCNKIYPVTLTHSVYNFMIMGGKHKNVMKMDKTKLTSWAKQGHT